jgi:hypothetical protein
MLGGERQQLVGVLQQRCRRQARERPCEPGASQRESQRVGMREPARLFQRRVDLQQCLIEMSEARELPGQM